MFIDILNQLAVELGLDISSQGVKELQRMRINNAARELYDSSDLPDSLREQLFYVDVDNQQISLPQYVDKIRGIRLPNYARSVTHEDMYPRYANASNWFNCPRLKWRYKGHNALCRDITNAGPLSLSVEVAEVSSFSVVVIYKTALSNRMQETLTFAAGELTKSTTQSPVEVYSIRNVLQHVNDVTVKDINDVVMGVLYNNDFQTGYNIYQILDYPYLSGNMVFTEQSLVEVLYKTKFSPFVNDYDEFTAGSKFDQCIYWKFKQHYLSRLEGRLEDSIAAKMQCDLLLNSIVTNNIESFEHKINFGPSRFFGGVNLGGVCCDLDPYDVPCR